jgi:hypothetical protein
VTRALAVAGVVVSVVAWLSSLPAFIRFLRGSGERPPRRVWLLYGVAAFLLLLAGIVRAEPGNVLLTWTAPADVDGRAALEYRIAITDSSGFCAETLPQLPRVPGAAESLWAVQRVDTRPVLYRVSWRSTTGEWAPASVGAVAALGLAPDTVYAYRPRPNVMLWAWTHTAGASFPRLDCPCAGVVTPLGLALVGWVWRASWTTADTTLGDVVSQVALIEQHRARVLELFGYVTRGGRYQ